MKSFFLIIFSLHAVFTYSQVTDYDIFKYYNLRLSLNISECQELKIDPTYYDHSIIYRDENWDTLVVYIVEHHDYNIQDKNVFFNGKDSITVFLPIFKEYVRVVYFSNPKHYSEFLLPYELEFSDIKILSVTDKEVKLAIHNDDKAFMQLTLPLPN